MPRCFVHLFTYKRSSLLPRAVQSLLNQRFSDWVCEVHNDCPDDNFPENYISSLNDKRLIINNHKTNLGATVSFNLAFKNVDSEYVSILEDDNWWEPEFLQEMVALMDNNPGINVAWSNMNLWQEDINNQWKNTGKTIWSGSTGTTIFEWPASKQAMGALHSNGSMIFRSNNAHNYIIPEKVLFNAVELIRERSFEHPILLNNKPLANFALTIDTHRSNDPYPWIATQIMMLASFIETSPTPQRTFTDSLYFHRNQKPNPVIIFFLTNSLIIRNTSFYKHFKINDWFAITKWIIRNGTRLNYIKNYLKSQTDTYAFLLEQTRIRYQEAKKGNLF